MIDNEVLTGGELADQTQVVRDVRRRIEEQRGCAADVQENTREHFGKRVAGASPGAPYELLTTGAVAELLGSSRQHVVNLCRDGRLAYQTVGSHRRVRRGDAEALAGMTNPHVLTRDQHKSLWLARATTGKLARVPEEGVRKATENLERMREKGIWNCWLEDWVDLLGGPINSIFETLAGTSYWAMDMRQNSPFAGFLDVEERLEALIAFKRVFTQERDDEIPGSSFAVTVEDENRQGLQEDEAQAEA